MINNQPSMQSWIFTLAITMSSFMVLVSPNCQHPIFCNEQILTAVANSNHFPDSKTFVDLTLTVPVEEALARFKSQNISAWIGSCFKEADSILSPVSLPDWKEFPSTFVNITTAELLKYALDLNKRWLELSRKINLQSVEKCLQNCSSFIPEMDGRTIIIPGGRFKEAYYWDSYWIVKGLIACDMIESAELLVRNFITMIETYGFIPNGFRQYFLNRSQPPFFALMVKSICDAYRMKGLKVKADALQERAFYPLVEQHDFFMNTHSKQFQLKSLKKIRLNFYNAATTSPRPQSYREDYNLVKNITSKQERDRILRGISSMAESGWDFSSRWLTNSSDLRTNIISDMLPSDLNTIMGLSESYLAFLSNKFERKDLYVYYADLLQSRKEYFQQIFNGLTYPDYIPPEKDRRTKGDIFPSDFYPYLLFSSSKVDLKNLYADVVNPASSSNRNGMQWDKPNVWAPNNWIMHEILDLKDGFRFAQQWISTTYCSWKNEGLIYEKYRNDQMGKRGEGGEYGVQTGFGWTNGLALYYLKLYNKQLAVPKC